MKKSGGALKKIQMKKFSAIAVSLFFMINIFFSGSAFSYSTQLESSPVKTTDGISNSINKLFQNVFQGFNGAKNININTSIPVSPVKNVSFDDIFNTKSFSGDDIIGAIKAVIILAINLFLIVINIVVEVFKGLLGVLNSSS